MAAPLGNNFAAGNDGGRPTKLTPELLEKAESYSDYLKWCENNPIIKGKKKITTSEDGKKQIVEESEESPRLPSLAGFASWLGISRETLNEWKKANKEISDGVEAIGREQEKMLLELGRAGEGSSRFGQFVLSARHEYREKSDVTTDGKALRIDVSEAIAAKNGLEHDSHPGTE